MSVIDGITSFNGLLKVFIVQDIPLFILAVPERPRLHIVLQDCNESVGHTSHAYKNSTKKYYRTDHRNKSLKLLSQNGRENNTSRAALTHLLNSSFVNS